MKRMLLIIQLLVGMVGLPANAKLIFPAQDDQNAYTGSANGCDNPPQLLGSLERHVAEAAPENYVRYDIAALNRKHVRGLYYVYSRTACQRLRRHFPAANVFVMARVTLLKCELLPDGTTRASYDVEAKVYSLASGEEDVIFRQRNVAREEIGTLLRGKETQLIERIASIIAAK